MSRATRLRIEQQTELLAAVGFTASRPKLSRRRLRVYHFLLDYQQFFHSTPPDKEVAERLKLSLGIVQFELRALQRLGMIPGQTT